MTGTCVYLYYTPLEKYDAMVVALQTTDAVMYVGDGSFPYPLTVLYVTRDDFCHHYKRYLDYICFFDFISTPHQLLTISMVKSCHIFGTELKFKTQLPVVWGRSSPTHALGFAPPSVMECDICYHVRPRFDLMCCSLVLCRECATKVTTCPQCRQSLHTTALFLHPTYPDYLSHKVITLSSWRAYKKYKRMIHYFYPQGSVKLKCFDVFPTEFLGFGQRHQRRPLHGEENDIGRVFSNLDAPFDELIHQRQRSLMDHTLNVDGRVAE